MLKTIVIFALFLSYSASAAKITTFAAPDNSFSALSTFVRENDNFLIAVYEFDNYDIAKLLQGKNFTLIVDEAPVGGMSNDEKFLLCSISKGNIYLYQSRYYMHAKYAVSSSKVLVSTENFGYDGFPQGFGNRGYGVIVEDDGISDDFTSVFNEDLKKSRQFSCDKQYSISERKETIYKKQFGVEEFDGTVTAVFAPNAINDLLTFINSSQRRLYIAQSYVYKDWSGGRPSPLLEAAIDRARKGVEVKLLLDSKWYNIDDDGKSNKDTVDYVNNIARKENIDLQAKLIDLNKLNFDELHGKLVIADNSVLVSSINWGENSPTNNREAGVIIYGDASDYYAKVFLSDWNPETSSADSGNSETGATGKAAEDQTPIIIAIVIVIIIVVIILLMRKK